MYCTFLPTFLRYLSSYLTWTGSSRSHILEGLLFLRSFATSFYLCLTFVTGYGTCISTTTPSSPLADWTKPAWPKPPVHFVCFRAGAHGLAMSSIRQQTHMVICGLSWKSTSSVVSPPCCREGLSSLINIDLRLWLTDVVPFVRSGEGGEKEVFGFVSDRSSGVGTWTRRRGRTKVRASITTWNLYSAGRRSRRRHRDPIGI